MPNYNFKFPLEKGINGFFGFNTTIEDATKEDIKNLLLTRKGERVIYKDYGTNVYSMLFEQKTPDMKNRIRFDVVEQIKKYVPTAKIENINVYFKEDIPIISQYSKLQLDDNSVLVILQYSIVAQQGNLILPNQSFALILQNG